ncbi:MAG: oxidoreductase [Chloroflexi bacterium]|nr:MAG: oxidoreductase [Chloroflexota bacterium]RLC87586.1 MAG: oxidoreductase [Chloroflexota bacterium]
MDIGIIGAGITGLTAAYDLTKQDHTVTLYEARPQAGGLAAGFRDERWEWPLDHFYHHWFASDADVINLIEELGARDRLFFPWPTTSIYHQGRVYPLDSPVPALKFIPVSQLHRAIRVLQFAPSPLIDRLRVGLISLYLTLIKNWRPLERVSADEWLRRAVGERAYDLWWKPLLISKFGAENYQDVNMAWMWARLHKRTARLGYFAGGFQGFADLLVERVQAQGGQVRLETAVQSVLPTIDGRLRLKTAAGDIEHNRVIATCSPQEMLRLSPSLPADYAAKLSQLKSMGALVLVLALKHRLTEGHYWINVPAGEGLPFMGLVEHTNYVSRKHYGDDHLVYCGDYLPPDHPYFDYSKEQLLEAYLPGLLKINPDFDLDWIRASWMFTEKYAQPVPTLDHSHNIPALKTPIPGLWLANMSQVYPWDRGSNYAVEMGRRVAQEAMK